MEALEKQAASPEFWEDQEKAREVQKERSRLMEMLERWEKLKDSLDDCEVLFELAREEEDEVSMAEAEAEAERISREIQRFSIELMLSGEDDEKNAIVAINAGAGGTEAQDWAGMLFRMYQRWCERRGYGVEIVDMLEGEEAGIKNVTFIAKGKYAYGYLKVENGVHRLVRISPFNASGKRHTSFASVSVYPEVDDEIVIDIDEKDLRIDTYRASGPGGQHVNKTSSAVRITHLPTGIVVQCQQEKSQIRNRELAFKMLRSRLYQLEKAKQQEKMQRLHENKEEIAWGSQIRSYVMQPYQMVKDHRINLEVGNVSAVLDGDIDQFIQGVLLAEQQERVSSRVDRQDT